jgi:beta-glucosidase/6-phospho-beta-glucosidase/beta-galactosidase
MFHWDVPQHLQDQGGFGSEFIIPHFVEYAKVLFEKFGDRVSNLHTGNNLRATTILN